MNDAPARTDPVARLILAEAGPLHGTVLVVDDVDGALCRAGLAAGARVLACCDDLRASEALPIGVERLSGLREAAACLTTVDTVLWRLPRSLDAVGETCELLAAGCPDRVRLVAGGRDKHLTPSMNPVMARSFVDVRASLGRWKSRVLHAVGPIPRPLSWPRTRWLDGPAMELVSYGAAFAAGRLDAGTRLLAAHLPPGPGQAYDAGCGTGVLAARLARAGWDVTASDVSHAAVLSTAATAAANNLAGRLRVAWRDGVDAEPSTLDLVVSNPPFHQGAAKDSSAAFAIIADAGRALRPGGELWLVYNAHLPYLPFARERVGPTQVVARDRSYLVTRSTRSDPVAPRHP